MAGAGARAQRNAKARGKCTDGVFTIDGTLASIHRAHRHIVY